MATEVSSCDRVRANQISVCECFDKSFSTSFLLVLWSSAYQGFNVSLPFNFNAHDPLNSSWFSINRFRLELSVEKRDIEDEKKNIVNENTRLLGENWKLLEERRTLEEEKRNAYDEISKLLDSLAEIHTPQYLPSQCSFRPMPSLSSSQTAGGTQDRVG
jgi:hypothetical protein